LNYSPVPWRTCQKRTTRCAVAGVSRSKFSNAACNTCVDGFVRTRYEAKAVREGRTPAYFIFRKT